MDIRVAQVARIVIVAALLLATVVACTKSDAPHRMTSRSSSARLATSTFAGLVLTHPRSWATHRHAPIDVLDPATEGYLTNEPVIAGCSAPRRSQAKLQQCGIPVAAMTPGGIYVDIGVHYQQLEDPLTERPNRTIAGFPSSVISGHPQMLGCPSATTSAISTTIAPTHLEPAEVDIVACFGGRRTAALHQQLNSMLASEARDPPAQHHTRTRRPTMHE